MLAYEGSDGPEYWVGLHNFFVITRYNRSVMYALAVHQLGQLHPRGVRDRRGDHHRHAGLLTVGDRRVHDEEEVVEAQDRMTDAGKQPVREGLHRRAVQRVVGEGRRGEQRGRQGGKAKVHLSVPLARGSASAPAPEKG